jgi:hypothetical protein
MSRRCRVYRQPVLGEDEQAALGTLPLWLLNDVEPASAQVTGYIRCVVVLIML